MQDVDPCLARRTPPGRAPHEGAALRSVYRGVVRRQAQGSGGRHSSSFLCVILGTAPWCNARVSFALATFMMQFCISAPVSCRRTAPPLPSLFPYYRRVSCLPIAPEAGRHVAAGRTRDSTTHTPHAASTAQIPAAAQQSTQLLASSCSLRLRRATPASTRAASCDVLR